MPKNPTRHSRGAMNSWPRVLLLAAVSVVLAACAAEPAQPAREAATDATPAPRAQAPPAPAEQPKPGGAPEAARPTTLADARGVVGRVYRDAVVVEPGRGTPFVVGDFNGDDSEDIAVVVKPARGKLTKINSEYSSWIVGDPREVVLPEVHGDVKVFPKRPEPVTVGQDDVLLAVIHGYRKDGWRDPLASQTYLLKNAVGDGMTVQTGEEALSAAGRSGKLPTLRGDVIRETLAGQEGFVYWTGAKYAWSHPADL